MKIFLRIRNFFATHLGTPTRTRLRRFSIRQVRHPMDSIPNEVLVYIFAFAVLDPDEDPTFVSTITQVCSRWRDLATGSANLWGRIVLTFPIPDAQLIYTSTALERSGTQPLTILLDCRDPDWDWEEESHRFQWSHMQAITQLLLPHAPRWQTLEVLSDTWSPIYTFLSLTKELTDLSLLESLSLSRCNAFLAAPGQVFQPESMRSPLSLFGGAAVPHLREVSLVGVHVDWDNSQLRNLQRLEFKYHASDVMPTIHQFVAILNNNPDLIELAIVGWGPVLDSREDAITTISVPSLQKLSFGFIEMEYSTTLLSLFHVPSLRAINLEDVSKTVNPLEDQDSSALIQWLYTSQPNPRASFSGPLPLLNPIPLQSIQELELHSIRASEELFSRFLQCFPRIRKLACYDVSDSILPALSPQIEHPNLSSGSNVHCLCPSLEELYVQDVDSDALIELVVARSLSGGVLLGKVTLEFIRGACPPYSSDEMVRLENTGITVIGSPSSSPNDTSDSD